MAVNARTASLNDGRSIPVVGLGTFLSKPDEVRAAVEDAYEAGYRHFDLATCYQNENEVGEALRNIAAKHPNFKREDVWLTGKTWNSYHDPANISKGLDQTLKDLGVDCLDLYLVHWPVHFAAVPSTQFFGPFELTPLSKEPADSAVPEVAVDTKLSNVTVWEAMIDLQKSGKVKSIGVSNFSARLLKTLINATGVTPAVNQVEAHPYLLQQDLVDFCKENQVHLTAYAPFGGDPQGGGQRLLGDPVVARIAARLGKDMGQVLASYGIKRGYSVLPKSVKKSRIASNFQVFDLDDESYAELVQLGVKTPQRYNVPIHFEPKWNVCVFDTEEEKSCSHVVF